MFFFGSYQNSSSTKNQKNQRDPRKNFRHSVGAMDGMFPHRIIWITNPYKCCPRTSIVSQPRLRRLCISQFFGNLRTSSTKPALQARESRLCYSYVYDTYSHVDASSPVAVTQNDDHIPLPDVDINVSDVVQVGLGEDVFVWAGFCKPLPMRSSLVLESLLYFTVTRLNLPVSLTAMYSFLL